MSDLSLDTEIISKEDIGWHVYANLIDAMPKPDDVDFKLNKNDVNVALGRINESFKLSNPSKEQVKKFFQDEDVRDAFGYMTLNYSLDRGLFKLDIGPLITTDGVESGLAETDKELVKDMKTLARSYQDGGDISSKSLDLTKTYVKAIVGSIESHNAYVKFCKDQYTEVSTLYASSKFLEASKEDLIKLD